MQDLQSMLNQIQENNGQLWIAGRYNAGVTFSNNTRFAAWELLGIYSDKDTAEIICTKSNDFVAPVTLGEDLPEETTDWPGCYYPLWDKVYSEQLDDENVQ